jgi:glycine betaine catabolism A
MITHKWAETYPELGTAPVPTEPCISPEYFERERTTLFGRTWPNVGRVEDVPTPGSYIVKDLPVAQTSIVVIRGKDGIIRSFHNMCSHRGNRLVWDTQGNCQALSCKFHGWTYAADGRLRVVPDEANFFDFDKTSHGLTPVTLNTWEGFVFINLAPSHAPCIAKIRSHHDREKC